MTMKDVIAQNLILPPKNKYTKSDFNRLVTAGHPPPKLARFICVCSAAYYGVDHSLALNWDLVRQTEYQLDPPLSR